MSDPTWLALKRYTQARIGLGRAGSALPVRAVLELGLAHAQARDAVHLPLDTASLREQLSAAGFESVSVHSAVSNRWEYLSRPDLGRRLDDASRERLRARSQAATGQLLLVIADGLSSLAVHRHALPLLRVLRESLHDESLAPVVIAEQGRVALGDEIGELWRAEQIIMLIGERPGLSAADSLGIYLTYAPRVGRTDAERNCISNVRLGGLSYTEAARRLKLLLRGARRLGMSGVSLKDDSEDDDRVGDSLMRRVKGGDCQSDQSQREQRQGGLQAGADTAE